MPRNDLNLSVLDYIRTSSEDKVELRILKLKSDVQDALRTFGCKPPLEGATSWFTKDEKRILTQLSKENPEEDWPTWVWLSEHISILDRVQKLLGDDAPVTDVRKKTSRFYPDTFSSQEVVVSLEDEPDAIKYTVSAQVGESLSGPHVIIKSITSDSGDVLPEFTDLEWIKFEDEAYKAYRAQIEEEIIANGVPAQP